MVSPLHRAILFSTMLASVVAAQEPPKPAEDAPPPPKIYECKDAEGNTVYQDDPCVAPKAAPKPAPAKPAAKPAEKPAEKPAGKAKAKAASPKAPPPAKPAAKPDTAPREQPVVIKAGPRRRPPVTQPPRPSGPVDPRWATPDATLRTFIDAIDAGDRELAVSCLTAYALGDLGPDPAALPLADLQTTVGSFTGYVIEGDLGPFWSIRALREGRRPKWIFFERTGSGEWKIGGI